MKMYDETNKGRRVEIIRKPPFSTLKIGDRGTYEHETTEMGSIVHDVIWDDGTRYAVPDGAIKFIDDEDDHVYMLGNHKFWRVQVCVAHKNVVFDVPSDSDPNVTYQVRANFIDIRDHLNYYSCTCKGYVYNKMKDKMNTICRHIRKVESKFCYWHGAWSSDKQTPEQKRDQVCPLCGSKTEFIYVPANYSPRFIPINPDGKITVTCGACNAELLEANLTKITNIEEDVIGLDVLYFECPKCGKDTKSHRYG